MTTFLQDLRYALRMLAKSPGFTATAVLTLALGIGAVSVVFSTVNAMILKPYAFKDPDRTVLVWETAPKQDEDQISAAPANFRDWSEQAKGFASFAAYHGWDANLTGAGVAERVEGYQVTADFFSLLGIQPQLGRFITASDFKSSGHPSVVVLSHGFWKRQLAANPAVVGTSVLLNDQKFDVVGIMPSEMDYPTGVDVWAPLDLSVAQQADRSSHYLQVIGRLKPGVSASQAQAELKGIASRQALAFPQTNAGHGTRVVGVVEDLTAISGKFIMILMWAAVFVLMLACANVANLQLARATSRQKEIVVRRALGATRWQIARQWLVESVLASGMGGVAGLLISAWGLDVMRRAIPSVIVQHVAGLRHLEIDSRVLAFTLAIAFLTGIVSGLTPALHASQPDLNEALKEGARGGTASVGRRRLRALLVVSEVVLALVLLVGAGLMVQAFGNLLNGDQGYDRAHVLAFHVALPESKYREKVRIKSFYEQVVQKLQALPGVESAALVTVIPSGWDWNSTEYSGEGQPPISPGELRIAESQFISPDYFHALRIPLLAGRFLSAQDGPDTEPVAVISQNLARKIWSASDPVGKLIKLGPADANEPWRRVVGVVGDIKQSPWDAEGHPATYVPFAQRPQASSAFVVRTAGDPIALATAVRGVVRGVDSEEPPYDIRTLDQLYSDNLSGVKQSARMMLVFGIVALALASAGIFAVMAYSVAQRTHEIGVRMALGAQRPDVVKLVVGYALKLTGLGLAIGLPISIAITLALSSLLEGVIRMNVLALIGFPVLLASVGALSAYIPARRASKVDPMVALRYE
ncbi:MAG TPA: ABC transporter permease [Terriglobia bacterium]|nr:ABC transporter permease [Terriglobia bacterium]